MLTFGAADITDHDARALNPFVRRRRLRVARRYVDRSDRSMLSSEIADLQKLIGRDFTYDAAANNDGSNAVCKLYASPAQSFLSHFDCAGHTVWLHPPFDRIAAFLSQYNACKQLRPDTSACILLPAWHGKYRKMLNNMTLLKVYPTGTVLFEAPDVQGKWWTLPGIPWPVEVWYDAPLPLSDAAGAHTARLTAATTDWSNDAADLPLYEGKVSHMHICALADTGASHDFMSEKLMKNLGLEFAASTCKSVQLADQTTAMVLGETSARLRLGPFTAHVKFLVIPELTVADVILGQTFLKRFEAVIKATDGTLRLTKRNRHITLKPITQTS